MGKCGSTQPVILIVYNTQHIDDYSPCYVENVILWTVCERLPLFDREAETCPRKSRRYILFYFFCSYFASLGKFAAAIMQCNHVSHVMSAPADGDAKNRLFVLQLRAYRTLRPPLLIDDVAFSQ